MDVGNCVRGLAANPQLLWADVAASLQTAEGESSMIRTAKFIFCDNEHGTGDVTYPDIFDSVEVLRQHFIDSPTLGQLRKDAKKAGWSRHEGADYCRMCTEGGI
jgi:hypothetical protein